MKKKKIKKSCKKLSKKMKKKIRGGVNSWDHATDAVNSVDGTLIR